MFAYDAPSMLINRNSDEYQSTFESMESYAIHNPEYYERFSFGSRVVEFYSKLETADDDPAQLAELILMAIQIHTRAAATLRLHLLQTGDFAGIPNPNKIAKGTTVSHMLLKGLDKPSDSEKIQILIDDVLNDRDRNLYSKSSDSFGSYTRFMWYVFIGSELRTNRYDEISLEAADHLFGR